MELIENKYNAAIAILKDLEWSKTYSYCTGWSSCPSCHGIKPGHGVEDGFSPLYSGHRDTCKLDRAIRGI